jgi:ribosomal protein L11 methyltransferase
LRFSPGPGAGTLQDMLYAELDAFEPVAIHEHESGDGWRVFFPTPAQRDGARRALASEFENALELQAIDVDDEDWARRSQAALRAIRAGRIVVAPPWDVPPDRRDSRLAIGDSKREARTANRDIVIIIDPSTGFGTGHHATTRLCLDLLQQIDPRGKRVIDVGTGSGVLAIAASKLAAREVIAIDHDPDALRNARENVARNATEIKVLEGDLSGISVAPADVVLANLTSGVLQRFADPLKRLAITGGVLIVSGFSPDDLHEVAQALDAPPADVRSDGEWAAASFRIESITDGPALRPPQVPTNGRPGSSN